MGNQWIDLVPRNTLLEYYRTIVTSNNVFLISMATLIKKYTKEVLLNGIAFESFLMHTTLN